MSAKMLYVGVCGVAFGVLVVSLSPPFAYIVSVTAFSTCLFFFLLWWVYFRVRSKYFLFLSLFFLAVGLGGVRTMWAFSILNDPLVDSFAGQSIEGRGVIVEEPDIRENNQRLTVKISEVAVGERKSHVETHILVIAQLYPRFSYGDEISVVGKISHPKNFETDSGRTFDYESYLLKDGIVYVMSKPKIELQGGGKGSWLRGTLISIKSSFIDHLSEIIPEPESSLLAGLLVGAKRSLGSELLDVFRIVGLIHIVVLSGYNLTIIGQFFMALLSRLGRQTRLVVGALSILTFALMVGLSATVIRASLMVILSLGAEFSYRRYDVSRALSLAALLMLLHNPLILAFDPSFQLSFLATIGLIYVSPQVIRMLPRVLARSTFKEIVVTTLSTQIFVTPYLLYLTGNLSLIALVSNFLVLPVIPFAMLAGFLSGLFSFIHFILAVPFAGVANVLLSYVLMTVDLLSHVPFASVTISQFPFWIVILLYTAIIFFLFHSHEKEIKKRHEFF